MTEDRFSPAEVRNVTDAFDAALESAHAINAIKEHVARLGAALVRIEPFLMRVAKATIEDSQGPAQRGDAGAESHPPVDGPARPAELGPGVPLDKVEYLTGFRYDPVIVNGHAVPFLQGRPQNGGMVTLTLDRRWEIDLPVALAESVTSFVADAIAVALGYVCHPRSPGSIPPPRQPFGGIYTEVQHHTRGGAAEGGNQVE